MRRRIAIGLAVVAAAVLAGIGWLWASAAGSRSQLLRLPGVVEIQEVRLASKQGGRVKEIHVVEGQWVEPGQEVVSFEAPELTARLDQLKAQRDSIQVELEKATTGSRLQEIQAAAAAVAAARAKWQKLEKGYREEEIHQAQTDSRAAEADATLAEEELSRASPLFRKRMISPAEYDLYRATFERARNRASTAKTRWQMMQSGGWEPEKREAEALMKQAEANHELLQVGLVEERKMLKAKMDHKLAEIAEVEAQLREASVRAPSRALIDVLPVRKGDVLAPNQVVARILRSEDMWVKVFVPETEMGKVRLNQAVEVTVDAYPGRRYHGKIIYIATQSEFTPRNIQSIEERRHQVFGMKVRVDDPAAEGVLKSGMAATVYMPLAG